MSVHLNDMRKNWPISKCARALKRAEKQVAKYERLGWKQDAFFAREWRDALASRIAELRASNG